MQVLTVVFGCLSVLSLWALFRFHFNLVFVYLFLLSSVTGVWSWRSQAFEEDNSQED
jgi:hypothetical protein